MVRLDRGSSPAHLRVRTALASSPMAPASTRSDGPSTRPGSQVRSLGGDVCVAARAATGQTGGATRPAWSRAYLQIGAAPRGARRAAGLTSRRPGGDANVASERSHLRAWPSARAVRPGGAVIGATGELRPAGGFGGGWQTHALHTASSSSAASAAVPPRTRSSHSSECRGYAHPIRAAGRSGRGGHSVRCQAVVARDASPLRAGA